MGHDWYDGDVKCIADLSSQHIAILCEHPDDSEEEMELHFNKEDLIHMYAALTGEPIKKVSPSLVTTNISRDNILALAKGAGLTLEELG
jgi:hypothetical protein